MIFPSSFWNSVCRREIVCRALLFGAFDTLTGGIGFSGRSISNGTTASFGSRTSSKLCMYRIAVLAKTLDFTVSNSASQTISAVPVANGNHTPIFRKWMTDDFLKRLHSVAYRVTKAECLDLPAITEEVRTMDLEKDAIKLYDSIEDESYAELDESEVTTANILTRILRLSQITGGHLTDDDGVVNTVSRAKLNVLSDIIDSAMAEDKKLVIMARFVPELDDIQELLEKKKIYEGNNYYDEKS